MDEAAAKLQQDCEALGRSNEAHQETVAKRLREFDHASDERRRALYERALFTGLGALTRAAMHDPDVLQALERERRSREQAEE